MPSSRLGAVPIPDLPEGFVLHSRDGAAWIEHALGNRRVVFTVMRDPAASTDRPPLDLGRTTDAPGPEAVESRRALCEALGVEPSSVRLVRQVHGDRLLDLGEELAAGTAGVLATEPAAAEADGFLLSGGEGAGLIPAIVTADCLPVAISGPRGTALLHLGWRGLSSRMLEEAITATAGSSAVIGPGIGPCCYEVGPEVFDALGIQHRSDPAPLDITSVASARLGGAGVSEIARTGLCTSCEKDLLFSHRRDGISAGRQMALIAPYVRPGS